jgi:hypothetical protein
MTKEVRKPVHPLDEDGCIYNAQSNNRLQLATTQQTMHLNRRMWVRRMLGPSVSFFRDPGAYSTQFRPRYNEIYSLDKRIKVNRLSEV